MEKNSFVTITGANHYYGVKPFEVGRIIKLVKEPDNEYDMDAIRAALPYIGKIGYVANSVNTVIMGTMSAGRVYNRFGDTAHAKIMFITHAGVICELMLR
ncbi:HIRAN domain-containing protein [Acetanaerobacterium elongatum]|uniref:HIRAN domain-containing protein n=1 Tax=Acetanaerobacterium elongatum TaxID=258515 RepID=A0A1G9UQY3_9FIRM|nr:HIRAN domain-containing protein [Acetanaerobacterium elongatum]SDM61945.1 HIRAN domain-containing protein [Acetanaerobacterium elongatum]